MSLRAAGTSWSGGGGLPLTGGTLTGDLVIATGARILLPDGTAASPPLSFSSATNDGLALISGSPSICDNGSSRVNFGSTVGVATGIPISIAAAHYSMTEMASEPGAVANMARVFAIDDGAKTELAVKFGTGARQQLSQEP